MLTSQVPPDFGCSLTTILTAGPATWVARILVRAPEPCQGTTATAGLGATSRPAVSARPASALKSTAVGVTIAAVTPRHARGAAIATRSGRLDLVVRLRAGARVPTRIAPRSMLRRLTTSV